MDEGKEHLIGGRKVKSGRGAEVEVLEVKEQLLGYQIPNIIKTRASVKNAKKILT
jgi:hypothetical protein